jgi:SAM-dependent methyltransferase
LKLAAVTSARRVEITDLLWECDEVTGERRPVDIERMAARLEASGQRRAARIARSLPSRHGFLDEQGADALMLRVHCELQRLGEELQLPRRLAEALRSWALPLLDQQPQTPVRVVDVGCGLGYVTRWLAAHQVLGPGVELVGVDLNSGLTRHASELARVEGLDCRFVTGDAFAPGVAVDDPARTIMVSSGLLHHFSVEQLPDFFAAQQRLAVAAFTHWDIDPSGWTTAGAWVFHQGRMRESVSRHDGVLSARRAHSAQTVLAAARAGAPDYDVRCVDGPRWRPALSEVLRPASGVRTAL